MVSGSDSSPIPQAAGAELSVLRQLNSLSTGRVGYAAVEVDDGRVWARACGAALRAGEAVRPELESLVDSGTPLGRLSAAALIARLDRTRGRALFEKLTSDAGQVMFQTGCIMMSASVADVALRLLRSGVLEHSGPPVPPSPVPLLDLVYSATSNLIIGPVPAETEAPAALEAGDTPADHLLPSQAVVGDRGFPIGLWLAVSVAMLLGLLVLRALQN